VFVPRLWNETIAAHRREVRDAILSTAAALADARGVRALTMSQIAEEAGIARATLYRYFPDVEAILRAWHERRIAAHLEHLAQARDGAAPAERVDAVLHAYALVAHERHGRHNPELAAFLHRDEQLVHAQHRLRKLIRDVLAEAARAGRVRSDIAPEELASFCLHALAAASDMRSRAAARRLVALTLAGLGANHSGRRDV
jgi:AcrR family transcriptional regulator